MLLRGNSFVKSGSLGKIDQNQQMWLKIKTAAIFDGITFFIWKLQGSYSSDSKI